MNFVNISEKFTKIPREIQWRPVLIYLEAQSCTQEKPNGYLQQLDQSLLKVVANKSTKKKMNSEENISAYVHH